MGKRDQGLESSLKRYQAVPRVLVFLRNGDDVLLLKGAPNKKIWANQYNGVGGHVEEDEDIITAARREVGEETGLTIGALDLRAVVNINAGNPDGGILMFVFVGWSDQKETNASHEGELFWVPVDRLPLGELVEDLEWLLPRVLNRWTDGRPRFLYYHYNEEDQLVIESAAERV